MRFMEWLQFLGKFFGKIFHRNSYLWSVMKKSSVSRTRRFTYFQIVCSVLEKCTRTHSQILSGKTSWRGSRVHHITEHWTQLMVSKWNSFGKFSQDSPHCSSVPKSKSSCPKWAISRKNLKDGSSSFRCSMTFHGVPKTMNRNANLTPTSFPFVREDFHQEDGHSSDLDQERSGVLLMIAGQGDWDRVAELMMIKFSDSGIPVFRATSPLCRGTHKSKGGGKLSNTLLRWWRNDWNCFSNNYFFSSAQYLRCSLRFVCRIQRCHVRTGRLFGSTIWPTVRSKCDEDTFVFDGWFCLKNIHCKSTKNEWKANHNQIVWLRIVFMQDSWQQVESDSTSWQRTLKISYNFQNQWHLVSTLGPRDDKSSDPKGWVRENTNIGPVLEVTTSFLQGKYGVEFRIEFGGVDNSHSLARISHGLNNKLVTDFSNKEDDDNEQELLRCSSKNMRWRRMYLLFRAEQWPQQNHEDEFLFVQVQEVYLFVKDLGVILSQKLIRLSLYPVSKQLSTLLRHGHPLREENGAIEFSRLQDYLGKCGRAKWQEAEVMRKDFNSVMIRQDKKSCLRAFQGRAGANTLILHYKTLC